MKKLTDYFTKAEIALWSGSLILLISSSVIFGGGSFLSLPASIIGVTAFTKIS